MRLSRDAKALHHQQITNAAAKMLRARGIDRTSVNDLMQAVGLTHGGFYRHFKSKDELVALSSTKTFDEVFGRLEAKAVEYGPKAALIAYVTEFLSDSHRDDPTLGCMVSACGGDAQHQSPTVRTSFTAGIKRTLKFDQAGLSCPEEKRTQRSIELQTTMLGALVMSRATDDLELAKTILATALRRALDIIEEKK